MLNTALRPRRRAAGGFALMEALIAMVVLTLGLLGMVRFQARVVQTGTESLMRMEATRYGDQLATLALADLPANAPCYTLPASSTCTNTAGRTATDNWRTAVLAALPGTVTATSSFDTTTSRLTVTVGWTGKLVDAADGTDARQRRVEVVTDVR